MNRRGFFSAIAAVAAMSTLDPERLLWRPGAKKIFIPPPRCWHRLIQVGDVLTFDGRYAVNPITRRQTKLLQKFVVIGINPAGGFDLWPQKFPQVGHTVRIQS